MKEKILMSAIYITGINAEAEILVNEIYEQTYKPKNVSSGFVIYGYRHSHCFEILAKIEGIESLRGKIAVTQGFISNRDYFHNRFAAAVIASDAGQIKEITEQLYSEDLY